MNARKFFFAFICTVYPLICFSQANDSLKTERIALNLKISYNSSLIYPGVRLGIEFPFKTTNVTKYKKHGQEENFVSEQLITGNISWYHHPFFHDNVYLTMGWTTRRTKPKGFLAEFSPEVGISRIFLGGTTYQVDDSGQVSIEKHAGYYYAFASIGGGIGYDFSKIKMKPIVLFYKFNILSLFPYNSTIYLRPAMEIGVIYKPTSFLSVNVKSKKK